jgi:four helix bundle protein
MQRKSIQQVYDLEVYCLSYQLAIQVFELSKTFPREELYTLTDQIRRSSRSVPANISEGFAKRSNGNSFRQYLYNAIGSVEETKTWISFARDFNYIPVNLAAELTLEFIKVGAMIYMLIKNWHTIGSGEDQS